MAITEVLVPQLSESVSEATLLEWKKKPGEAVEADEILIEVETDKVVLEVPAPASGVLSEIVKGDGSTVGSGEVLARIDSEGKVSAPKEETPAKEAEPAKEEAPAKESAPAAARAKSSASSATSAASPAANKILAEKGIDPSDVDGSGRSGRVTKADAMAAEAGAKKQQAAAPAPTSLSLDGRPEQRVPMSRLRARVAERLLQSQSENAILTTFNEVNMQGVLDIRARYKDKFEKEHGVKLGFTSFFVKAAVAALKKYPVVNASVDGKDIIYHGYFDIGIA
ncbi:MAG: 2-oxo acid dehydrogenase subunit E2, partial [Pusillimonas sp.]|nr:2-oxo acid dehydrogenase subunit E2 [Pusillimonas sp.]